MFLFYHATGHTTTKQSSDYRKPLFLLILNICQMIKLWNALLQRHVILRFHTVKKSPHHHPTTDIEDTQLGSSAITFIIVRHIVVRTLLRYDWMAASVNICPGSWVFLFGASIVYAAHLQLSWAKRRPAPQLIASSCINLWASFCYDWILDYAGHIHLEVMAQFLHCLVCRKSAAVGIPMFTPVWL